MTKGLWFMLFCLSLLFVSCVSGPPQGEKGMTIAVWDLDDLSPAGTGRPNLGELLAGQVIEALKKKEGATIVERQRLVLALEELRLGTTALADEATRLKLGRLSGARWMIFGGYQVVGNRMRLDLRLVEVETGKIRKATQQTAAGSDIQAWMEAAKKAAGELLP